MLGLRRGENLERGMGRRGAAIGDDGDRVAAGGMVGGLGRSTQAPGRRGAEDGVISGGHSPRRGARPRRACSSVSEPCELDGGWVAARIAGVGW